MALLRRREARAGARAARTSLDQHFIDDEDARASTSSRQHLERTLGWDDVLEATGLTLRADRRPRRDATSRSDRIIVCWAMGLTQHKAAVATIREIVNLHAAARQHRQARRRAARRSAGTATCRATGRWASGRSLARSVPRRARAGVRHRDAAGARPRRRRCDPGHARRHGPTSSSPWAATSSRPSPTRTSRSPPLRRTRLTVQVSTKLNRSHVVTGEQALILPTLGPDRDRQSSASGAQFVSVEDTVCAVHASHGRLKPRSPSCAARCPSSAHVADRTLGSAGFP